MIRKRELLSISSMITIGLKRNLTIYSQNSLKSYMSKESTTKNKLSFKMT